MVFDVLNVLLALTVVFGTTLALAGILRRSGVLVVVGAFATVLAAGFGFTVFSLGGPF